MRQKKTERAVRAAGRACSRRRHHAQTAATHLHDEGDEERDGAERDEGNEAEGRHVLERAEREDRADERNQAEKRRFDEPRRDADRFGHELVTVNKRCEGEGSESNSEQDSHEMPAVHNIHVPWPPSARR